MVQRPTLTGTRIRERRLSLSRRQGDVARAAGISPAYLNLIEHNRRPVGEDLLARLAEALDLPPSALDSGADGTRIEALRAAAAAHPDATPAPEAAQAAAFLARYPGWAGLVLSATAQAETLRARLIALSDRMSQDPHLLATLHEVLSAVTSLRATASILAEDGLDAQWAARFRANLAQDGMRLSTTAQALVAYLDSFETGAAAVTPLQEVEAWMAAGCPAPETAADLASDGAREMAQAHLTRSEAERAALPDGILVGALLHAGADPGAIAAHLGAAPDLVMRRLAALRPGLFAQAGLIVCDGAGAALMRRPAQGFPLARMGDSCAVWPLFQALSTPQMLVAAVLEAPDGARFDSWSYASRSQPAGAGGPVLVRAHMLMVPQPRAQAGHGAAPGGGAAPAGGARVLAIGPTCRICPRPACPARREPSILPAP